MVDVLLLRLCAESCFSQYPSLGRGLDRACSPLMHSAYSTHAYVSLGSEVRAPPLSSDPPRPCLFSWLNMLVDRGQMEEMSLGLQDSNVVSWDGLD